MKKTKPVIKKKPVVKPASVTWDAGDGNNGAVKDVVTAVVFTVDKNGGSRLIVFSDNDELARKHIVCAVAKISAKLMEMEGFEVAE